MAYKCSCGKTEEKAQSFSAHFTHYKGPEHQRIGWEDPDTGRIYKTKPRARKMKQKKAKAPQTPRAQDPKLLPIVEVPQTPTPDAKLLSVVEVVVTPTQTEKPKTAETPQAEVKAAEPEKRVVKPEDTGQLLGVQQLKGGAVLFSIGQLVIPVSLKELYDTYLYLEDMMIKNDLEEIDFSRGILLCTRHCWQELNHHRAEKQGLAVTTREPVLQEV